MNLIIRAFKYLRFREYGWSMRYAFSIRKRVYMQTEVFNAIHQILLIYISFADYYIGPAEFPETAEKALITI